MALTLVTAATFAPVSTDKVKDRLRLTGTDEDPMIRDMIYSATQWCENVLNWKLCTQTWKYFLDYFPGDYIRLPYPPLQSVTHVKYYNTDNVLTTLTENTNYRVDSASYPARIDPINGWPSTYDRFNSVEIQFVCGFTDTTGIIEDIKDAIHLRVADLYEIRQNTFAGGVNSAVENTETSYNILMRYKLFNAVV